MKSFIFAGLIALNAVSGALVAFRAAEGADWPALPWLDGDYGHANSGGEG